MTNQPPTEGQMTPWSDDRIGKEINTATSMFVLDMNSKTLMPSAARQLLKRMRDDWSTDRAALQHQLASQDAELTEKQKYVLFLERAVTLAMGDYAAGMQAEREHQHALARFVDQKHREEVDALKAELAALRQELVETLDKLIGIEEWYDGAAEDKHISRRNELVTAGYESEANDGEPNN